MNGGEGSDEQNAPDLTSKYILMSKIGGKETAPVNPQIPSLHVARVSFKTVEPRNSVTSQ